MKISIVIPVFNEAGNLLMLQHNLNRVLLSLEVDWEVTYVNDGSFDASADELQTIWEENQNIKIITLARNYGQTQALAAGIDSAEGEIIITMDADQQNDPADIPKLLAKLEEGYDVVSGWRVDRQDSLFWKKIPSFLANKISFLITKVRLHDLGCTLKAYKKEVLDEIEFYGEIHRFLPLCAAMQGARIAEIPVRHNKRKYGNSKYGIFRIFNVILDMLLLMFMWNFITKPIYIFGGMGLVSLGGSVLIGTFIMIRKIFFGGEWVSPLLFIFVILSIMGIQFILMGILAELIIRLYYGARSKKRYSIKKKLHKKNK